MVFTLEQSRFLADGSVDEEATVWSIPLLFATPGLVSEEAAIMDQKVQTFAVRLDGSVSVENQWIKINAGQKALVRVAHSPEMTKRLISAMTRGGLSVLSPVDRAALLLDGYALAKAGLAPLDTVVSYPPRKCSFKQGFKWYFYLIRFLFCILDRHIESADVAE